MQGASQNDKYLRIIPQKYKILSTMILQKDICKSYKNYHKVIGVLLH